MRVMVVGDSCRDVFVYGAVDRICPEGPVPVLKKDWEKGNNGMAMNVVANLQSLGNEVKWITNENIITKTRYVDERSNQLLLRVDDNDSCDRVEKDILYSVRNNNYDGFEFDALIIADYDKGFLEEDDIAYLCQNNTNVFIDTKKQIEHYMGECSYIKINEIEWKQLRNFGSTSWYDTKTIVTLGGRGCRFNNKHYTTENVTGGDVSGAGDTFMAALVTEYIKTNKIDDAIKYALKAATSVVKKSGVSIINSEDMK